jgi:27-O-demethylrifamycin SV methyltransferase
VRESAHDPAVHYDRAHAAWRLIMGEEFHYGYFEHPRVALERATAVLTEQMIEAARIATGERILDIGCGTGHQACELAERFGASVLGITTSAGGVEAATELAARRGISQVRFERRDGTDNGLADESFDLAWALESSHLMRDRAALLGECARVLVPGGRLVLCDIVRKREIPFPELRSRVDEFATLRAAFGDAHMEPLEDYAASLRRLGMSVTRCEDITEPTRPTFSAWRGNIAAHAEELRTLLPPRGVQELVTATHILEAFWQDGTLGYGILAALKPR